MFTRILLPLDGSENSVKSIDYAIDIAKKFNSEVIIFHTFTMPLQEYIPFNFDTKELEADILKNCNEIIVPTFNKLKEASIKVISGIKDGSAGFMIIREAESEKCDLIIMGSRGQTTVKNFLIGSVSNYVLHHTKIPVLLIH